MKKVILLDRDGVINQDSMYYIKSVDEFIVIPESIEAIARLTKAGYQLGVATNQSGVTRGLYTEQELLKIHDKLLKLVEKAGGKIEAIEYCLHMPDAGCSCRKPQPGMLLKLAEYFHCEPSQIVFVGDRVSDIQAAEAAGMQPILVLSPMTNRSLLREYGHVSTYNSLAEYVNELLLNAEA